MESGCRDEAMREGIYLADDALIPLSATQADDAGSDYGRGCRLTVAIRLRRDRIDYFLRFGRGRHVCFAWKADSGKRSVRGVPRNLDCEHGRPAIPHRGYSRTFMPCEVVSTAAPA